MIDKQGQKDQSPDELLQIPGVGPNLAGHLHGVGIKKIADLKERSPEELYERLCAREGLPVDRCVLYVFRCAVYYASSKNHDPELLKWWNWKDSRLQSN